MPSKASDLTPDSYTSFLFKGPFGFGKTIAAATFARLGSVYIAYWDKKKPIELREFFNQFGKDGRNLLDNIDYDVYGSTNAHEYINRLMELRKDCRYSAVITDSVTNMTAGAVNWSLGFRDPKGAKKDKLNSSAPQLIPDFDEYKVETSLVSQALDISRTLPCNIIWIAHPLPTIKVEGAGASIKVTKTNSIVTYGSKVAGMVPGNFTEIYHFSQESSWDSSAGKSSKRFVVNLESVGDEFAKSPLLGDFIKELDITDKFFYDVWKQATRDKEAMVTARRAEEDQVPEVSQAEVADINLPKW